MTGGICVTALLAGALTGSPAIGASTQTAAAAAASCPSAIPTYVVTPNGSPSLTSTLRRYVDWDPQSAGHLFSAEKSAGLAYGHRVFSGGGTRLFKIGQIGGGWDARTLGSFRDQSETGGSLLSLEYTYEARAGQNWNAYTRIWSDADGRVVNFDEAGNLNVYVEQFPDGTTASARMSRLAQLPATNPALVELSKSTSIWSTGNKIYGLLNETIRSWDYSAALNSITLGPSAAGTVVATGLTGAATAWSPAPGVFYTKTTDGAVKKYAGSPLALINDDFAVGLKGSVFAAAASCLSSAGDEKPYFGQIPVDDPSVPSVPPASTTSPPPSGPEVVSGRFLLPDGSPAAGMNVVVEASDLLPADNESVVNLPDLGSTTTDADGNWSLTIPESLPPEVQTAVSNNGGALNVTATTTGRSESGVTLVGTDNLTAAPEDPGTGTRTRFATTVTEEEGGNSVKLLPALADPETVVPDPTTEEQQTTYAAQLDTQPTDDPNQVAPRWQSDRGTSPEDHNPYLINGTDITSEQVTPRADTCYWDSQVVSRQISYTVVGESHAYWDAAGNVEYKSTLSNTIDVGYSAKGSLWSVSGSASIGSSAAGVSGFSWRGPYVAKQWKVPIEYNKIKKTWRCGGVPVDSYYEIRPSKFKVPAGQPVGAYGKDARQLDGPVRYANSNPKYRSWLAPYGTWAVEVGKSVKWSGAAVVLGVSLGASTSYDSSHKQNIRAGGKTARKHYIWGYSAPPGAHMGVIYSN
ncbi:hypothetical protein GCM10010251_06920 [Streptomyces aurantiogriseus]|uniref:Uncharacterized protein n=2 Tax=Streptomyces aurantiogriseus TaxID=66870 RepID=A0A918F2C4_9ACTN|nr:hypothetical protein GCM10010251_06920 [Streptomyces aurantiogriseus]